jgi:hypothetical protein
MTLLVAARAAATTRVASTEQPMRMGNGPADGAPTFVAGNRPAARCTGFLQKLDARLGGHELRGAAQWILQNN